jgi:DNA-binding CsgD family transcriptional regulator/PAS domain-containing protein
MQEISDLIGAVYDCTLNGADWAETLERIADFCGAENAAVVLSDPRIRFSQVITPRADPDVVAAYGAYWWQHDVTSHVTAGIAPGVITDLSVTGRPRFFASAFYNEFWAKSGLGAERLATNLFCDGPAFGSFVLQAGRGRDEITAEMHARFALLMPHAQRAVAAARRIGHLEQALSAGLNPAGDGMILVDGQARVLHADHGAEALLRGPDAALRVSGGALVAADPRATDRLLAAIRACANPQAQAPGTRLPEDHIALPTDRGRAHLSIRVQRLARGAGRSDAAGAGADLPATGLAEGAVVALLLSHSGRRRAHALALLSERWGLTAAEARMAIEMMHGDGRAAAAARCGISVNTARTHLTRVFEKAGVRRQAELIRRMADLGLG